MRKSKLWPTTRVRFDAGEVANNLVAVIAPEVLRKIKIIRPVVPSVSATSVGATHILWSRIHNPKRFHSGARLRTSCACGKKPRQDDGRKDFIRMKATGMGGEIRQGPG